jgi:hypothetical protein
MTLSKALSDTITALVAAHSSGQMGHDWQRDLAKRFGALGVYSDIGGALMLRPDGSILGVVWDDEMASVPQAGWKIIGLAAASYFFPELAVLAPERPAAAWPCLWCSGIGCASCFGMGWLLDAPNDLHSGAEIA